MWADLRRTLRLFWEASPGHATAIVGVSVLLAFVPAATLWTSKLLLDGVAAAIEGRLGPPEQGFARLVGLLAIQVGISMAATLLGTLQRASRDLLGDALQNRISLRILSKAAGLEVERFENAETYDALRNAWQEVGSRPLGVATQLVSLMQASIALVSIGALMSRLGPGVMPLVLLASVPDVIVSSRFGTEGYRMLRRRAHDARVQNYLGSILLSDELVKEVRLFGFEDYLIERWQAVYRRFRAQLVDLVRRRSAWGLLASLSSAAMVAGATALVLVRAASGNITVGDFSLFVLGIAQAQNQFSTVLGGVSGLHQNLLYMRNLFEFLELPVRGLDSGEEWNGPIHTIEFRNVGFRYPLTERDVLAGLSFRVERGQALALVGENGAGKTTVVKLLTRMFEPTSGEILLNGLPAARFSPRSVQREISAIFQDYGRYQMTARENVALADLAGIKDDARLKSASERSGARDFVPDLPQGLDTPLGRLFQGGRQLSGGQWQRLALARLHFREASVLVFDEPTAALDANAEFAAIEALRAQARGRIAVLISHRFSTVRLADRIVVLEGGIVTESGTHESLLARDGAYAALYRLQARGYAERVSTLGADG